MIKYWSNSYQEFSNKTNNWIWFKDGSRYDNEMVINVQCTRIVSLINIDVFPKNDGERVKCQQKNHWSQNDYNKNHLINNLRKENWEWTTLFLVL